MQRRQRLLPRFDLTGQAHLCRADRGLERAILLQQRVDLLLEVLYVRHGRGRLHGGRRLGRPVSRGEARRGTASGPAHQSRGCDPGLHCHVLSVGVVAKGIVKTE